MTFAGLGSDLAIDLGTANTCVFAQGKGVVVSEPSLIAFNTSTEPLEANVEVDARDATFTSLQGECASRPSAPGSYPVKLKALDYIVCSAQPVAKAE